MKLIPKLSTLFHFSDAFAWLIFIVATGAALAMPLVEFAPRSGIGRATEIPLYFPLLFALVAFGALSLTRRHLLGLPLVMLLPFAFDFFTDWFAAVSYSLFASLVFGAPFMLAFVEARRKVRQVAS
ncbi:MAG: hypothetical protein J0I77_08240 [Rudaea sp.]|uniref:hypothetical protein n=1 Tax=unclassified Rudaea TaxID=2627037 RepID=UPI0010F6E731|nr:MULTISPECIES: hypothetical protein [unclassified Rudaea]MBN8885697.1 hypothetical protein [Rudaea sp.]MBR0345052.1 hypothetical protein [Rudaea sp.]